MATARRTSSVCWSVEASPADALRRGRGLLRGARRPRRRRTRRGLCRGGRRLPWAHARLRRAGGLAHAAKGRLAMQVTEELVAQADPSLALGRYRLGPRSARVASARSTRRATSASGAAWRSRRSPQTAAPTSAPEARSARGGRGSTTPASSSVFDAGEEDGSRFLVSELVGGRDARPAGETPGEVSDRDVLRIGLALADALAHAHERGVIHRDVKPQNVMVPERPRSPYGAAKLDRLRRRPSRRRRAAHPHRRRRRHARLHGSRAGRGRARRRALRPLRARRSCSTRRWRA